MKQRTVTATEFKAKCLALIDEVQEHGGTITVTKRGKPVAELAAVSQRPWKSPKGMWKGKVVELRDLANIDNSGLWECTRESGVMPD